MTDFGHQISDKVMKNKFQLFFSYGFNSITNLIEEAHKKGKTIAIWGAGNKCRTFLEIFDPQFRLVEVIFDIDESKYGYTFPSGHKVVDYRKHKVDIVIFSSNVSFMESHKLFSSLLWKPYLASLDSIVWGDLSIDELEQGFKLTKMRRATIAAVVILYHPDNFVVHNILSYASSVDYLYIFDNSECSNSEMFDCLTAKVSYTYFFAGGINYGIGAAINKAAIWAKQDGADWLFTFDQDSYADEDMVMRMRNYIESMSLREDVGIVSPCVIDHSNKQLNAPDEGIDSSWVYEKAVIQSGALHRLSTFEKVGGYDERLFIDYVDLEYCARCRTLGFIISCVQAAKLYHQMGSSYTITKIDGVNCYMGKYSPQRYYYQCRNMLYCRERYKEVNPVFANDCQQGLDLLYQQVKLDTNYKENMIAIKKAEQDYAMLFDEAPTL